MFPIGKNGILNTLGVLWIPQVVEMNFNSINFDICWKVSFPASSVIYYEDALLMMYYHSGLYCPE